MVLAAAAAEVLEDEDWDVGRVGLSLLLGSRIPRLDATKIGVEVFL